MIARRHNESPSEHAEKMTAAMTRAWRSVIAEHKREGLPMVIWRDGRVQHVDAAELEREADAAAGGEAGETRER